MDRVHDLFQRALDVPVDERTAFLDAACGDDVGIRSEVTALLSALDDAGEFLVEPPRPPMEKPGDRIGRYRLLEEIGEGGFGTVWLAEQIEPVRRKVALKVLKAGMDTRQVIARFEAERQALALMDHPHIARVLDGGSTDLGRPFFVMDLVPGLPIHEFCDRAAAAVPDRLRLFVQVCLAVEHAHQKGIVHRDLKPGNVLVTLQDGLPMPKVIDFGVAKAVGAEELTQRTLFTGLRNVVGTPEYMAPEQTGLSGVDVDTRADVYALGVLLYELLTGSRPFSLADAGDKGYPELLRRIRENEPVRPSTRIGTLGERLADVAKRRGTIPPRLLRALRGDLDWIVVRALAKERDRRYPTASALAADVQRHLDGLPVEAGPPSALYRLTRLAARHRTALAAVGAVAVALVVAVITIAVALGRAIDAQAAAKAEATRARSALSVLETLLGSSNPHALRGPDVKVRDLLDEIGTQLDRSPDADPDVEATLRSVVGGAFRAMGLLDEAEPHLARALALRRQQPARDAARLANVLWQWAWLLHDRGRYDEAEQVMRESLQELGAAPDSTPVMAAEREYALADLLRHRGRLDEADAHAKRAIDTFAASDDPPLQLAMARHERGMIALDRGHPEDAEQLFRQALATFSTVEGEHGPTTAMCLQNLGTALLQLDRASDAEQTFAAAVAARRAVLGSGNPLLALPLDGLALARIRLGRHQDAEGPLREAIELRRPVADRQPQQLAWELDQLASVLEHTGRHAEAATLANEVVAMCEQTDGQDASSTATALARLGSILLEADRPTDAEPALRRCLAIRTHRTPNDWLRFNAQSLLGEALDRLGRDDEAEALLQDAFDHLEPPAPWADRRLQALDRLIAFHASRVKLGERHAVAVSTLRNLRAELASTMQAEDRDR